MSYVFPRSAALGPRTISRAVLPPSSRSTLRSFVSYLRLCFDHPPCNITRQSIDQSRSFAANVCDHAHSRSTVQEHITRPQSQSEAAASAAPQSILDFAVASDNAVRNASNAAKLPCLWICASTGPIRLRFPADRLSTAATDSATPDTSSTGSAAAAYGPATAAAIADAFAQAACLRARWRPEHARFGRQQRWRIRQPVWSHGSSQPRTRRWSTGPTTAATGSDSQSRREEGPNEYAMVSSRGASTEVDARPREQLERDCQELPEPDRRQCEEALVQGTTSSSTCDWT